jgi:hypothetical protein
MENNTSTQLSPTLQEEYLLNTINFASPEDVKNKMQNRDVQLAMVAWVENNLRPLEDNANYLRVVKGQASDRLYPVNTPTIQKVIAVMMPYVLLGTPAHELGHHLLDALGGSAIISNDSYISTGYRNDINGAFFGAMFHDSSTGVQHRYVDNLWELNHGEIAAVIFYHRTAGLLSRNLRLITAYAIAAHPHSLKDMPTTNGAVRKPWNDELFLDGERPVRLAVWITRWSDRLENGADPACHFPRHLLAALDAARVNGMDLSGVDWFNFNDQLRFLFTPQATNIEIPILDENNNPVLKDGAPQVNKIPTLLQGLQNYRISADTAKISPYNQHDDKSPNMRELMDIKVNWSKGFVDSVTNTTGTPNFETLVKLLTLKSGNPLSETGAQTIEMVRDIWEKNTPEDQSHWAEGFEMGIEAYYDWLEIVTAKINAATDPTIVAFAPLAPEILEKLK